MKRKPLLVFCGAIFLVLACNLSGRSTPASPFTANDDIDPATALFLAGSQPRTLDPALTHDGPSGALGHIFTGLVSLDTALQVQPELAAGWEVDATGTVYTFYLRRNAVFHDGRPVTAEDVVYSWARAAAPAAGSDTALTYLGDILGVPEMVNGQSDAIGGLRLVDDYTLEVTIDAPKVYFLAKLAFPVAAIVDRNNVNVTDWEHHPNGTGPFKLQAWRDDEILILARNESYYLEPAYIEHVVYLMGAGFPLSLYEKGEIDLTGISGRDLQRAQDPNNPLSADLVTGASMCTTTIGFDTSRPPFDDPLVRQAFNFALDKETLITTVFSDNALVAHGSLPPGMPGYNAALAGYSYDPVQARDLLVQAGYGPGLLPELTYYASGYNDAGSLVTAAITMWQETLGVSIEVILLDPFTYYDELYAGNVGHLYSSGWCADYPDPQNFLDILYHSDSPQNIGRFHNSEIDALLVQARSEQNVTQRLALYRQLEEQIVAAAPAVHVAHSSTSVLVKPTLQNYVLTPIGVRQWHQIKLER